MVPWQFFCSTNNCEKISYKITEFGKGKTRSREHNRSQSPESSESSNNQSIIDHARLNNVNGLIIGHLNTNYLRNKFEMLREIVHDKLNILLVSETKVDLSFPSNQFAIRVLVLHFDVTEIVQEMLLSYLLGKKFLQNF